MKEHPIIFSTPMVQAILEGRKTMTRRICRHQQWSHSELVDVNFNEISQKKDRLVSCPYGAKGDILWVRERFCNLSRPHCDFEYIYYTETLDAEDYNPSEWKWKPSIHMPRKACRIFLEIVSIRVERLQDISTEDAKSEGIVPISSKLFCDYSKPKPFFKEGLQPFWSFNSLWCSINSPESWEMNPFVWVIKFKRLEDYK